MREEPQLRRDPVTGDWRLVTSKEMLEAERTRPRAEQVVKEMQAWADERARRQRQVVLDGLREQIRRRNE